MNKQKHYQTLWIPNEYPGYQSINKRSNFTGFVTDKKQAKDESESL